MKKKALFVVAHPDDAELAAGGTISLLVKKGWLVRVLNLTVSEFSKSLRQKRIASAQAASIVLGHEVDWFESGIYNQVEDIPQYELIRKLDRYILDFAPSVVYTHAQYDSHFDHICTFRAVIASSRKWDATVVLLPPNEFRARPFMEFIPNYFFDISDVIEIKKQAIECYNFEGQNYRSLDGKLYEQLNGNWGLLLGIKFAEGFQIYRQIQNPMFL